MKKALSDKIHTWPWTTWKAKEELSLLKAKDVREFIKKLKENLMEWEDIPEGQGKSWIEIKTDTLMNLIDNIFGAELTESGSDNDVCECGVNGNPIQVGRAMGKSGSGWCCIHGKQFKPKKDDVCEIKEVNIISKKDLLCPYCRSPKRKCIKCGKQFKPKKENEE